MLVQFLCCDDYLYVCQILVMRNAAALYAILKSFPRYIIIPHRLIPSPPAVSSLPPPSPPPPPPDPPRFPPPWCVSQVVKTRLQRGLIRTLDHFHGWRNMSCCMDRQNCHTRADWVPLRNSRVPLLSLYGLITPLGNSNFLDEIYHTCTMTTTERLEFCP